VISINQGTSKEISPCRSIQKGFPLAHVDLYVMIMKSLGYLLQNGMIHSLIKGIHLHSHEGGQPIIKHFAYDFFLMIQKGKETMENTMDYLQIVHETYRCKL
jgi:hypothetical protein